MFKIIINLITIFAIFTSLFVAQDSIGQIVKAETSMTPTMECSNSSCGIANVVDCNTYCMNVVSTVNNIAGIVQPLLIIFFALVAGVFTFLLILENRYFYRLFFTVPIKRRLALVPVRRE